MQNSRLQQLRRILRFLIVGGVSTLCQYCVLWILVERLSVKATAASCIGYGTGAAVNYTLNRYWTFEVSSSHSQHLPRFVLMVSAGFLLNGVLMYTFAETWNVNYMLAQVFATAIVIVSNYLLAAGWVFKETQPAVENSSDVES